MAAAPLLTVFTLAFLSLNNFMLGSSTVIDWTCNTTELGNNTAYKNNVKTLLHNLVDRGLQFSALREGQRQTLNDTNTAFGLFQCIGDVSQYDCNLCGQGATYFLRHKCPHAEGATLWSNWCFLRFESYDFFSKLETPRKPLCREPNDHTSRKNSRGIVQNLVEQVCGRAMQEKTFFATKSVGGSFLNSQVEIKGLAQCWKDLSREQCEKCLGDGMKEMEQCYNGRNSKAEYFSKNCIVSYVMTLDGDSGSKPGGWLREKSLKATDGNVNTASHL